MASTEAAPDILLSVGAGEHVFACFHPVSATPGERLSFQRGGQESLAAALPAMPTAATAPSPEELAAVGAVEAAAGGPPASGVSVRGAVPAQTVEPRPAPPRSPSISTM